MTQTTMRIEKFAFVFPSQKRAEEFLKDLNALIDQYESKEGAEKDDCYMLYTFEG